jgi:hypothetical protein
LTATLLQRSLLEARRQAGLGLDERFRAALGDAVAELPYELVRAEVRAMKGLLEIYSRNALHGLDDGNWFVDDVHGTAFDLDLMPVGMLFPPEFERCRAEHLLNGGPPCLDRFSVRHALVFATGDPTRVRRSICSSS